jgi:Ca2+-binding RTX toxin-like protein
VGGSVTDELYNIERVIGSSHNDIITGSGNTFVEEFDGRGGDDTIDGNGGFDRVSYEQTPGGASDGQGGQIGVSVNLGAGTANDGLGGTDTLIDIDAIEGSNFTDNLIGRDDAPTRFRGRAGNDTLAGGTGGGDSAAYWFSGVTGAGVVVTLAAIGGTATGATVNGAINHTLNGIENVIGSEWADTLTGDAGDNELNGLGGSDILDGGDGFDTVNYRREPQNYDGANQGVSVDLAAGSATDSFGSTDSLIDIENVVGTDAFGDTLSGDSNGNALIGLGGNDLISGLGGADFLNGGTGIDTILGGAGNDTIYWVVGDGSETLDGGADFDTAQLNADPSAATGFVFSAGPTLNDATVVLSGASSETLVLTEIESVVVTGGASADSISFSGSLAGTPVAFVTATGGAGNDVFDATSAGIAVDFRGGNGDDTLTGDALGDFLGGGPGNDMLTGGGGNDIFGYGSPDDGTAWDGEANASLITADEITDFTTTVDKIQLNGLEFEFTESGLLDETNFVVITENYTGSLSDDIPSEYTAKNGTVIVDGGGQVIYDGNGSDDGYSVLANVGESTPVVSTDINVVVPA